MTQNKNTKRKGKMLHKVVNFTC